MYEPHYVSTLAFTAYAVLHTKAIFIDYNPAIQKGPRI